MHVYEPGCYPTNLIIFSFEICVFVILKVFVIICLTITMHSMHAYEGEQNVPPQNMPVWNKDYLELVIFKNNRHRKWSENLVDCQPFVGDIYIYVGNLHL